MRFGLISILCAALLAAIFLPIPTAAQDGSYNPVSHLAYCRTQDICLHEIAHALDQQAGWVSQSPEFQHAFQMYLLTELHKPKLSQMPVELLNITYRGGDGSYSIKLELYAYLFQWSHGDPNRMPESLVPFYDWELAAYYMKKLDSFPKLYWLN